MKTKEELSDWVKNLPQAEKAKMMFQIKKRQKQEKKQRLKNLFDSLFEIFLTLGRILFVWIIIMMPIALSISILSKYNIIPKYVDDKSVYYIGWIIFFFSCIYGVKTHLLLRKLHNRKEK